MTDDNMQAVRGKPAKAKRTRRNYVQELRDLESRVAVAIALLKRVPDNVIVAVAIETLEVQS
jgi:hypothetical protein